MAEPSISKQNLDRFISLVRPELEKLGFVYKDGVDASSSRGSFANGFFVSPKYKIGIIFSKDRLGSINYDIGYTNIGHHSIFTGLGLHQKNRLKYNGDIFAMYSYTLDGSPLHEAFLEDFKEVIFPYFQSSPIEEIKDFMLKEREKMGL